MQQKPCAYEENKDAIILYYQEGHTLKETAEYFSMTNGAVYKCLKICGVPRHSKGKTWNSGAREVSPTLLEVTTMHHHIYRLRDPRTNEVRYIGITCKPAERYIQHLSKGDGHPLPKKASKTQAKREWVQELRSEGLQPIMEIIESHEDRDMGYVRERYWITTYFEQGADLFNTAGVIVPVNIEKAYYLVKNSQYYSSPAGADALVLRRGHKLVQIVVYSIRREQIHCKIVRASSLKERQEDSAIDEALQLAIQRELEVGSTQIGINWDQGIF